MQALAVHGFWGMRGLIEALEELAERERTGEPNYPMCCLMLYAGGFGADDTVDAYVRSAYEHLDRLTGDDCLVFVSHVDGDGSAAIEVAKRLDIPLQAMPCCVFFVPAADHDRVLIPLERVVTGRGVEGIETFMRVITQTARDVAHIATSERLNAFLERLNGELAKAFPVKRRSATPTDPASRITAASGVVAALAAVAQLFGISL